MHVWLEAIFTLECFRNSLLLLLLSSIHSIFLVIIKAHTTSPTFYCMQKSFFFFWTQHVITLFPIARNFKAHSERRVSCSWMKNINNISAPSLRLLLLFIGGSFFYVCESLLRQLNWSSFSPSLSFPFSLTFCVASTKKKNGAAIRAAASVCDDGRDRERDKIALCITLMIRFLRLAKTIFISSLLRM